VDAIDKEYVIGS